MSIECSRIIISTNVKQLRELAEAVLKEEEESGSLPYEDVRLATLGSHAANELDDLRVKLKDATHLARVFRDAMKSGTSINDLRVIVESYGPWPVVEEE